MSRWHKLKSASPGADLGAKTSVQTSAETSADLSADIRTGVRNGLVLGLAASLVAFAALRLMAPGSGPASRTLASAGSLTSPVASTGPVGPAAPLRAQPTQRADFGTETKVSADARHIANWVADARDNAGADFVIVDKLFARLYVFDAAARLQAATPVLLGSAPGDDSVPGIGDRPIPLVRPEERTTPAGRFVGERGVNTLGEDVVWVDYEAAVSMHRVRNSDPKEHRLARLASPTTADNRISYGCINLPVKFYDAHIGPRIAHRSIVVYVLPEHKPVQQVFNSYDVAAAHSSAVPTLRSSKQPVKGV